VAVALERRRRVRERDESYVLTEPGGRDRHRHCATVNTAGHGFTAPGADGHVHEIVALVVLVAGDGHRHELSAERCTLGHAEGRCLG
jgi:hypothetical protein